MQAYRVACHLGDNEEDMDATMRIVSSAVFNKVMVFMIKEVRGSSSTLRVLMAGKTLIQPSV